MKENVAAVVVTYNRKDLLVKCLYGLLGQRYPVDRIYIVDNASTDETFELLGSLGLTANPIIQYVRMQENIGGAGGFHEGVKLAYESGYNWIWLMDDDVCPHPDCLSIMLRYKKISDCIHPRRHYNDFSFSDWEGYIDIRSGFEIFLGDRSFPNKEWVVVNFGCFEGMLISRNIVRKIGFPRKEYFYIKDDTEYGFLASKYTNCIYLRDALMKKLIDKRFDPPSPMQCFLMYRNYVGFLARKLAQSRLLYCSNALYFLLRGSVVQLVILSPVGLISIWFGFMCGIFERWGDEKRYLSSKISTPALSKHIYRRLKQTFA
jgi:GT2 family glycosyltransferase